MKQGHVKAHPRGQWQRSSEARAWGASLTPSTASVSHSSPCSASLLGHNLHCKPPGSSRPGPCRKLSPYHRAWIPPGFLNQEKALKRVRKSLTSSGCFSIWGSRGPQTRGKNLFKYRKKQQGGRRSCFTFSRAAEGAE